MSVRATGQSVVIIPRLAAGPAHQPTTAATAPRGVDGDTFQVATGRAAGTGPRDSLRRRVSVDDGASGAYFHKVVATPSSAARGIRAAGRLPEVLLDPRRFSVAGGDQPGAGPADSTRRVLESSTSVAAAMARLNDWRTGPLDRPSVYLGGRSGGQEADVGLTWDRVIDGEGRPAFTDKADGSDDGDPAHRFVYDSSRRHLVDGSGAVVAAGDDAVKRFMIDRGLQPSFGFRPYWRVSPTEPGTTNWTNPPTTTSQHAEWAGRSNHVGAIPENMYFAPGARFAMNVRETGRGQLRMDIRDVDDGRHFHVGFRASGFGTAGAAEWKRVSSIDQKGSEKKDVLPTSSMAIGLQWAKTEVLMGDALTPTAMASLSPTLVRGRDLKDPTRANSVFNVDVIGGVETVTIRP
jgi:hypothetical protein